MLSQKMNWGVTCGLNTFKRRANQLCANYRFLERSRLALAISALALLSILSLMPKEAQAQAEVVLYSFANTPDGDYTNGRLTADKAGNLYGTTVDGGANGDGTVFELSPEPQGGCAGGSNAGTGWCETVLYSFCSLGSCADGSTPLDAYVTFDSLGNLYSTTADGGTFNNGTVFELSPEPNGGCPAGSNPGNNWCETVLYSFQFSADSGSPSYGLVLDSSGNLYGTTFTGGNGNGSVYELSPNGNSGWTKQIIYSVDVYSEGSGLAIDAEGNLYGFDANNHIFKLTFANGAWTATDIHTFAGSPKDGLNPNDTPTVDGSGNVYGTTASGGSKDSGTVWKLIPFTKGKNAGTYEERILHSFTSPKTGDLPSAGVTLDSSGNIYGTTPNGGAFENGTVYELALSGTEYEDKLLWSFDGSDGFRPYAKPIVDSSGNLYGTTSGGANGSGFGAVYEVIPSGIATETVLTSSPNPSITGEAVTFTATVSSSAGTPPDGEIVSFIYENFAEVLGTAPLSGGSASFTTSSLPFVGAGKIIAVYGGDLNFSGSTSKTVNQVVKCTPNCG
jgi:uncharacterized repeat protein (TIGR03803 family)